MGELRERTASFGQIRCSPASLGVQVPAERIEAPWRQARLRNSRGRAALALDMIFGQPKRSAAPPRPGDSSNPLEQEILQEQAATLGRVARELEAALGALENFDRANPDREALSPDDQRRRAALVEGAGEILWWLVIQREACGLYRTDQLLKDYRVPAEVRIRMGMKPSAG